MTDDATPPRSGSRWEPGDSAPSEDETTRPDAVSHEPPPQPQPQRQRQPTVSYEPARPDAGFPAAAPAVAGRTPLSRRIPLAVAALAVAVVGGLGGFAIGQAAARNNESPVGTNLPQQGGQVPDGDHHGFGDRFGPGGGQPGGGNGGSLPQGPFDGSGTGGSGTNGT